jgi:hypothetical protein
VLLWRRGLPQFRLIPMRASPTGQWHGRAAPQPTDPSPLAFWSSSNCRAVAAGDLEAEGAWGAGQPGRDVAGLETCTTGW